LGALRAVNFGGLIPTESRSFSSGKSLLAQQVDVLPGHHRAVGDRLQDRLCRPEIEGLPGEWLWPELYGPSPHTTEANLHHGLKTHGLKQPLARDFYVAFRTFVGI
jgi:hypothetical protein